MKSIERLDGNKKVPEIEKLKDEPHYEKPYGLDVLVRSFYFRHAEKASGNVGTESGFSTSNISERGRSESAILGEQLPETAADGLKIAWSGSERTKETAEAMVSGLQKAEEKMFKTREKSKLGVYDYGSKEFADVYLKMWNSNKIAILKEMKISENDYNELDTNEQAKIAEKAEESVIQRWLDNPESELAKLSPPEVAAAHLAIFVRKNINMPQKLKSGSKVDLLGVTHKTITEPLLMRIIKLDNGGHLEKLEDIGGSLGLNEGWEVDSFVDEEGEKRVRLFVYRVDRSGDMPKYIKQEYCVDLEELDRLAELGLMQQRKS